MNEGWIKVHRKLLEWDWADTPPMMNVWMHLLLGASYENKKWHNRTIERGQMIIGIAKFALECGVSDQQLRTCLERLVKDGQITKESTNKYTIITICKYDDYQVIENVVQQTNNKQTTNEQQTDNKQITTSKEYKEYKESKEIKKDIIIPPLPPIAEASSADVKRKVKKKEPDPNFNKCKEIFLKQYEEQTGTPYCFTAKDAKSLQELIKKINFLSANTNESYNIEDNFLAFVTKAYQASEPWIKEHFTLPIINSKFNEIYNSIKNGRQSPNNNQRNANAGISRGFFEELARDING